MNTQLLNKVASVLEAMADEYDARAKADSDKIASVKASMISPIIEKVSLSTGEDEDAVRAKLSSVDTDLLGIISKLASEESPVELGGPNRNKTASAGQSSDVADKRFLAWLSS
jgi:hypothetical protein